MTTTTETTHYPRRIDYDKINSIFPNAYFDFHPGCSEPGYDDKPVITADWNHVPNKVFDRLESLGFSCEWSDEWIACDNCYKVFRTSPDCYHWQMAGEIFDGYALCLDCMEDEIDDYYHSLENNPRQAVKMTTAEQYPPEDHGYAVLESGYEAGWHPWQNANPAVILKAAQEANPGYKYLFVMTDQGQFDLEFSLYYRIPDDSEAGEDYASIPVKDDR